jgi:hypothetical protein
MCIPPSRIRSLEIYNLVYLLPPMSEHYKLSDPGGNISKYGIAIVYRHPSQSVVEISSSTAIKQLLIV